MLICDFHREQAWDRWVKKSENGVAGTKDIVLHLLREIASAENEAELEKALQDLYDSEVYEQNLKLRKYFEMVWLQDKEV